VKIPARRGVLAAFAGLVATGAVAKAQTAPSPPDRDYLVFVASEGNDQIALVRFGPAGARVERRSTMGTNRTELVGPHGIAVSPDGKWYYVTTAHGMPNGAIWKFSTANDEQSGRTELGRFPATIQLAPGENYAWVVNFNLYGDMVPSTVSVVYTDPMIEVKRIPTCVMPHGSRLSPDGSRHYSACMMNDVLVEVDAAKMEVSRHFMLKKGAEHGMEGAPGAMEMTTGADGHGMAPPKPGEVSCSPTWAQPSTDGKTVWVACNKSSDLVEIDVASWSMRRRIPTGDGIYNLAASHDGRLVVGTNKRGKSVSIIDATSGAELARIPTTRRLPSGLVISPDDRYAFVTLEGVGSEPGTVEIIDLRAMARVASVDVGQQAGGIDFWKTEPH
jgi:DNA-binding beta-propeller fold protein YncE